MKFPDSRILLTTCIPFWLAGAAFAAEAPTVGLSTEPAIHSRHSVHVLSPTVLPALYQALARDAGSAYKLNAKGCTTLPGKELTGCFNERGVHFSGMDLRLALSLVSYGREKALSRVKAVEPVIEANQVSYSHGNLTEWWRVLSIGFEQGFTIKTPPAGSGELILVLSASRQAVGSRAKGTLAWDGLRYGKLVVTDAKGQFVPATLKNKGNRILIAVNDVDASYPLIVDPLVWLEQKVTASDGAAHGQFGISAAISDTTALIGSTATVDGKRSQGEVYVFTKVNGTWSETQILTSSDGEQFDNFGTSIALDGSTALIGANCAHFNPDTFQCGPGQAYIFKESGGVWNEVQILTASDGAPGDSFGQSVALDGTTAVVGAIGAKVNGHFSEGAAYVFADNGGDWMQTAKLVANDGASNSSFGVSIDVLGTAVLVGAPGATVNGNRFQGAVYEFKRTNDIWTQTQKLVAAGGADFDAFGSSIAGEAGTALIGAPFTSSQGAVYVFTREGTGAWTQLQKLIATDGKDNDVFGDAIALHDTNALIGAPGITFTNVNPGAAYVFTESNGEWSQSVKLTASDGAPADNFGWAVTLDGSTALVGSYRADIDGNFEQGAAYFYETNDLDLTLDVPDRVNPGERFSTSTIVTNSSDAAAPSVEVSIAVPAAASFISATATQGTCNEGTETVHCDFGEISGNAGTASANVTLQTLGEAGDSITSHAELIKAVPPLSTTASTLINHPPVTEDGHLTVDRGQSASGLLKASDADGDQLVFGIVTPPKHGKVSINDTRKGVYTYTPDSDYVGGDSFTFNATDAYADSNVSTVIVNVTNQPPVAVDGTLTTDKNVAAQGSLQASDPDDDSLSFALVAPPGHGSITLDASSGAYTYTPATGYFGSDSFTFMANDGYSNSNVATVHITVQGNAPPPSPPPSNDGGGGSFGALLLMLLAGLTITTALLRRGLRKSNLAPQPAIQSRGRKETNMPRRNKLTASLTGMLALVATMWLAPLPAMAQGAGATPARPAGMTRHTLSNTRQSGMPGRLVAIAPQSDLALLSRATKLGPHAPKDRIELIVGLRLRNVSQLKTFLQQVQNPASPVYRQWLTPEEFTALYGPTKADVAQVVAFLEAQGITVKSVSPNRTLIHTVAPTRMYSHAFGIEIADYRLNGRSFYSTADRPKLPRELASRVLSILGLNHGQQMRPLLQVRPLFGGVVPQAAPPAATAYFNPQQIATAYEWPDIGDTANGAGVTIAVLTALSPNVAINPNYEIFWNDFGLPSHDISVIPVGGESFSGGEGETTLDIEWSSVMAPGADLNVYVAANAGVDTFATMYNRFVTDNDAAVMTTSWGLGETAQPDLNRQSEQIFMQGAAQGISMFAASGDWGAADCPPPPGYCPPGPNNADFPSSSKYITAANGTELTIADVSGTYGNEHAWADTGGAISELFERPAWQTGPGVPPTTKFDTRMNSDIAMNAGPLHPYLVYASLAQGTGYYGFAGTSAVAPILAGMFAIAVSRQPGGARLGQSNKLLYDAVNAGHYTTDYHDVIEGCNGVLPDGTTPSCAKAKWDHPTGWGSPRATSLMSHLGLQGPSGALVGTVTSAVSGNPIAGVSVTASSGGTSISRETDENGHYAMLLQAGDYTITASDFGFTDGTAMVTIVDGETTTQDLALAAAPSATLSGKVSDDSGHGYGLYAEIKVTTTGFGQVADVWTDPATGEYSVSLPKGFEYSLQVAAAFNGYNTAAATVTLSADTTRNFPLAILATCTAPGYAFLSGGLGEDFNGETFPPAGWSVTSAIAGAEVVWKLNSAWDRNNVTGGTGTAADADSGAAGPGSGPYDTSLVTPPIAVTSLSAGTVLRFKASYINLDDVLDLDISTDGGTSWTTVLHWTTNHGTSRALPGFNALVDLAPYLPDSGNFRLRWRYHSNSGWHFYAMIDGVFIGACTPLPGGLVTGQVSDFATGEGIVGARVEDDLGEGAPTVVNPADPDLPVGTYLFFASAGDRTLTATAEDYSTATAEFTLNNNAVVARDFALKVARLEIHPDQFNLHVMVNNAASASFAIKNTGTGTGVFHIFPVNAPPPASDTGNSLIRVPVADPALMKASLPWIWAHAQGKGFMQHPATGPVPRAGTAWEAIADYPLAIAGNFGARDPATGKVYVLGGVLGPNTTVTSGYVYDPDTDNWSSITDAPTARESAAVGFINGKLYVVGGWSALQGNPPATALDIYDPTSNTWSRGTPDPVGQGGGVAHATLNGKLYLVGGCSNGSCDTLLSAVQVYDPATDRWSAVADYPEPIEFAACGAIQGRLYCAGGLGTAGITGNGYVYSPARDVWSPIADMTNPKSEALYAAANGLLLVAGGRDSSNSIINAVEVYDPVTDNWDTSFPPMNTPIFRGAGFCGFYQVGGIKRISAFGQPVLTAISEVLPGYDQDCGGNTEISWLTVTPGQGTLAAGASTRVTLFFDGSEQRAFTTSEVYLAILNNTPYGGAIVPLTVTWDPQPVNLALNGSVVPKQVRKGHEFIYTITVQNRHADNHGAATRVELTYPLPPGVDYVAASGDAASCELTDGAVVCDFGTIALGASKTETLAMKAVEAGKLTGNFEVSAREPDSDSGDNRLGLTSVVIGTADLALDADSASIPAGSTGSLKFTLKNAGPDPAAEVQIHTKGGGEVVSLLSATTSQGHCNLSGDGVACELGQVDAGKTVSVTLRLLGLRAGSATVNAQTNTASEEPDGANNGASATVTVKEAASPSDNGGGGGGGALDWLALIALLGLGVGLRLHRRPR